MPSPWHFAINTSCPDSRGQCRRRVAAACPGYCRTRDRTRILLEEALRNANARVRLEMGEDVGGVTLQELVRAYTTHLTNNTNLAPASIQKYRASLDGFCRIVTSGMEVPASSIQAPHIELYRDQLREMPVGWQKMTTDNLLTARADKDSRRIDLKSVGRDLERVRKFWRWAIDNGKVRMSDVPGANVRVELRGVKDTGAGKVCPTVQDADKLISMPYSNRKAFDNEA